MSDQGKNTQLGKILRARLFRGESINMANAWFAIGTGSWVDKQSPPVETGSETGLTVEYARKKVTKIAYLQQDAAGAISWRGFTYKEVEGPTAILGYFGVFTEDEVVGVQICEEGFFFDNVQVNPPTLTLALAGEVVTPGTMIWLRNRPASTKAAQERYTSIFVDDSSLETPS